MSARIEFTVEPFDPGRPGRHVSAAIDAARGVDGVVVDVGPFGTSITGPTASTVEALQAATIAALREGATRVSSQVERLETEP
ncbi:MAG: hypothetical protein AAGD18_02260 [Actinomycetota bacterium]